MSVKFDKRGKFNKRGCNRVGQYCYPLNAREKKREPCKKCGVESLNPYRLCEACGIN